MAIKTISLELDAYNKLKRAKRGKESFSAVVRRARFDAEESSGASILKETATLYAAKKGDRIGIDSRIANQAAIIRRELRIAGQLIGDFDILIGATAIVEDLPLVTHNAEHFIRIPGLRIISYQERSSERPDPGNHEAGDYSDE